MKNNNFEKIGFPGTNEPEIDLRSYALKQYDYVMCLARTAKAEGERSVQNALSIIRSFPRNFLLIKQQVRMIENRLSGRINQIQRESGNNLPGADVFKGDIIAGFLADNRKQAASLSLDELNKNTFISGKTGEGKTNIIFNIVSQLVKKKIFTIMFDFKLEPEYRNLLQLSECSEMLVLPIRTKDRDNIFDPDGENMDEWLLFIWDILQQSYDIKQPTQIMLLNYCKQLHRQQGVFCLNDLQTFLEQELNNPETRQSEKNKIHTCLNTINVIRLDAGSMLDCKRGYSFKSIFKEFSSLSYEFKNVSEHGRKWIVKLKLRRLHKALNNDTRMNRLNVMIVADEAKVLFGKDLFHSRYMSYTKQLFTQGRGAFGLGWIIADQSYTTELADFVLENIETHIFLRQTLPFESRNIGFTLGCDPLEILSLHQPYVMMRKSNWPYSFKVWVSKSPVSRRFTDQEVGKNTDQKLLRITYAPTGNKTHKKVKLITKKNVPDKKNLSVKAVVVIKQNPLSDLEAFLRYINDNPGSKVTDIYKALKFSGRKGNGIKSKAKENDLISEKSERGEGKGRPSLILELTDKGKEYINEKRKT
ncbi:MAG: DUF87 domain-containing protein [Candidatus Omnitrophota bacterium]|nr:DUF87 domain-containing protein [Candidatus Omnitrophota bacterium]